MDKQALLEDVYNASFQDELEKVAKGKTVMTMFGKAPKSVSDELRDPKTLRKLTKFFKNMNKKKK